MRIRTKYPNERIRGVEDMEGDRVSRGNKDCRVTAGESPGVVRGKTGFFSEMCGNVQEADG